MTRVLCATAKVPYPQCRILLTWVMLLVFTGCSTTRIPENAPPLTRAERNLKLARQRHIPTEEMAGHYLDAADDALKVTGGPKERAEADSIYNDASAELTMRLRLDDDLCGHFGLLSGKKVQPGDQNYAQNEPCRSRRSARRMLGVCDTGAVNCT